MFGSEHGGRSERRSPSTTTLIADRHESEGGTTIENGEVLVLVILTVMKTGSPATYTFLLAAIATSTFAAAQARNISKQQARARHWREDIGPIR